MYWFFLNTDDESRMPLNRFETPVDAIKFCFEAYEEEIQNAKEKSITIFKINEAGEDEPYLDMELKKIVN